MNIDLTKCLFLLHILCILIDASGWVISDVSFRFTGWGFGSCNIRPPCPNDPVGIDLTPTSIPAANLRIFHTRQMTAEMALCSSFFISPPRNFVTTYNKILFPKLNYNKTLYVNIQLKTKQTDPAYYYWNILLKVLYRTFCEKEH